MSARRFVRPPTPAEYARMTQAMRLAAAEDLADRLDAIEARRSRDKPPVRRADDWTPEDTLMAAHAMLPIVARDWPDPPHVQLDRQRTLLAAKDTRATVRGAVA